MAESNLIIDVPATTRFFSKLKASDINFYQNTPCHEWTAYGGSNGYGQFQLKGRPAFAHRVAWVIKYGAIPDGLCVLHHCDNPPCCNPEHLFLGTMADNMRDRAAKGRTARGEKHGWRTKPERVPRGDRNGARTRPERLARGDKHGSHTKPERRARGDRHGKVKLTESDIPEIFALRAAGLTQPEIGAIFGVARSTISSILHRKNWAYIAI